MTKKIKVYIIALVFGRGGVGVFLRLGELKKRPLTIFYYDFKEKLGELGWLIMPLDYKDLDNKVYINMETYYSDSTVFLSGAIETVYTQSCSRCLELYQKNATGIFKEELRHIVNEEENILTGETEEKYFVEGDIVDLTEFFRQIFVVSQDLKPLCDDECLGICSGCGVILNYHQCDCKNEVIDPRLAVLSELKAQLKDKE